MSPIVLPEYSDSLAFSTTAALNAAVALEGSWEAFTSFVVAGLSVSATHTNSLYYVQKYVGLTDAPADIRRLRKSAHEVMRRLGQPVIVKHMWNDHDARVGVAKPSPVGLDAYGQQVRNRDPFSYGTGYCSVQVSPNEWINPTSGAIETVSTSSPAATIIDGGSASSVTGSILDSGSAFSTVGGIIDGGLAPSYIPITPAVPAGFIRAPFYRGYGPGFLTYILEPDVAMDLFKLSPTGALIKVQSQTVVAPWFPEISDNDLIINVELDQEGNVIDTHERYQAKRATPISIRGRDRLGRRTETPTGLTRAGDPSLPLLLNAPTVPLTAPGTSDHGNRHVINFQCEMNLLPETSVLYQVETDR